MKRDIEKLTKEVIEAHKENHGYLDHIHFSLKKEFSDYPLDETMFEIVISTLYKRKLIKAFINDNETVLTKQAWAKKSFYHAGSNDKRIGNLVHYFKGSVIFPVIQFRGIFLPLFVYLYKTVMPLHKLFLLKSNSFGIFEQ